MSLSYDPAPSPVIISSRSRRISLESGTWLESNACSGEPCEVPDAEDNPDTDIPVTMRPRLHGLPGSNPPQRSRIRQAEGGDRADGRFIQSAGIRDHRRRGPPQPLAQLALRARDPLREGRQHRRERRAGRLLRRQDGPLAEGQAGRPPSRVRGRRLVGPGEHPARAALVRHQPRAGRSTISTRATASIASTASPAGTRSTASRCA